MKPKDRDGKDQMSGVIYSYQSRDITCSDKYIGETSRTLGGEVQGISQGAFPHTCAKDSTILSIISTS